MTSVPAKTPSKPISARVQKETTRSPSDDISSPFSKLLLGGRDSKMAHKDIARVLFNNGIKRSVTGASSASETRSTPVKSALAARKSFLPYRSPTDAMVSPATRIVRSRSARAASANAENDAPPPFVLPQKTKSFDLQRSFHMLASGANARNNKLRKLSRSNASAALGAGPHTLGRQRSGNDQAPRPTSTI